MSLREDISTVADVADILAYEQRAEMLANQAAQLAALRDIRNQAQIQSLRAAREKILQDTLFALRRSLPTIAKTAEQSPHKAASDVILAHQTLQLVPSEAFSTLEWKELSVQVRSELDQLVDQLQEKYGESMTKELIELRDAAAVIAAEERLRKAATVREYEAAAYRRKDTEDTHTAVWILAGIIGLFVFILLFIIIFSGLR